jgi:hypothetical protein
MKTIIFLLSAISLLASCDKPLPPSVEYDGPTEIYPDLVRIEGSSVDTLSGYFYTYDFGEGDYLWTGSIYGWIFDIDIELPSRSGFFDYSCISYGDSILISGYFSEDSIYFEYTRFSSDITDPDIISGSVHSL